MPDVSYFRVEGDSTLYTFNDPDAAAIDDNSQAEDSTWSSAKIAEEMGNQASPDVPLADYQTGTAGVGSGYARGDHRHPANVGSTIPGADTANGASGTSNIYARADHKHKANVGANTPRQDGTGSAGTSSVYAREDHRHPANGVVVSMTLTGGSSWANWGTDGYVQTPVYTYTGGFVNAMIDLLPDATLINQMIADGVTAMYVENVDGSNIRFHAFGAAPSVDLTVQTLVKKVQA